MKFSRPKIRIEQKLVCYEVEIAKYKHLFYSHINIKEAKRIIKLLAEHFKIKIKGTDFSFKSKWHGGWAHYTGKLKFRKEGLNLGIVCHELCHLFCYKKKIFGHSRQFYNNLISLIDFIEDKLKFIIRIK